MTSRTKEEYREYMRDYMRERRRQAAKEARPRNGTPWSEEEWTTLQRMRAAGETWGAIDKALGRNSRAKWENERGRERAISNMSARATQQPPPLAEHQSLTAAFFGDPLPGRSALDRRQAEASNKSISLGGLSA